MQSITKKWQSTGTSADAEHRVEAPPDELSEAEEEGGVGERVR